MDVESNTKKWAYILYTSFYLFYVLFSNLFLLHFYWSVKIWQRGGGSWLFFTDSLRSTVLENMFGGPGGKQNFFNSSC